MACWSSHDSDVRLSWCFSQNWISDMYVHKQFRLDSWSNWIWILTEMYMTSSFPQLHITGPHQLAQVWPWSGPGFRNKCTNLSCDDIHFQKTMWLFTCRWAVLSAWAYICIWQGPYMHSLYRNPRNKRLCQRLIVKHATSCAFRLVLIPNLPSCSCIVFRWNGILLYMLVAEGRSAMWMPT